MSSKPLAIITGGTSGIGLATAHRLSSRYRLALVYARDSERAQTAQAQFADPDLVKAFRVDVASDDSVEAGYPQILEHFGCQPDVLINSAGVSRSRRFFVQGRGLDHCKELMNINYFGILRMTHKVIAGMYSRRRGSVVNLGSISATGGYRGEIGYSESKAAIECFTRNLAVEVSHRGVAVNCVSPGLVETRMTETLNLVDKKSVNFPLGRAITTDEVAQVIEFLVLCGPAVNGQNITIDGASSLAKVQLEIFSKPTARP